MTLPEVNTPVKVTWLDTTSLAGWHYFHEGEIPDSTPRRQITRGVLVGVGEKALTLAFTISPQSLLDSTTGLMNLLIVPVGCVEDVQVIP